MMNSKHTNIPYYIQSRIQLSLNRVDQDQGQNQPLEALFYNLRETQDIVIVHKTVNQLKKFTSNDILQSGILPYLVDLTRKQISPQLTVNILKIFVSSDDIKQEVFRNGGIELFVVLLESKIELVQPAAIQILDKFFEHSRHRDQILYFGGLRKLIYLFKHQPALKLTVMNTISQICSYPPHSLEIGVFFFEVLLIEQDIIILAKALNKLYYLNCEIFHSILEKKIINRLIDLMNNSLRNSEWNIVYMTTRLIDHIVQTDQIWKDFVFEAGSIKELKKLIIKRSPSKFESDLAYYIYSILDNIAKGNHQAMISVLYDEQILDYLLKSNSGTVQSLKRVVSFFSNCIINGCMQDLQQLMEQGLFRLYKKILKKQRSFYQFRLNSRVLEDIIEVLEKGNQFDENYYLIECKQLELIKLIKRNLQRFQRKSTLYKRFLKFL